MHMKMRSENKKMNPSCLIPFVISFHSHLIATPGSVVYGQLHCCGFIGKLNKKNPLNLHLLNVKWSKKIILLPRFSIQMLSCSDDIYSFLHTTYIVNGENIS